MSPNQEVPLAEVADRRWELIATAVLLLALKAAASAAMLVVEQPWARYLDWFEAVVALAATGIVLWLMFFKFTRVPSHQRHRFLNLEGYVADTIKKAVKGSWASTFLVLTFLSVVIDKGPFASIPAEFYVHCSLAVMLGVFSLSFFILNHAGGDHEDASSA